MDTKHTNKDSSSRSNGSSPSKSGKDSNKQSPKGSAKDKAPSPKSSPPSDDSDSPESAPSEPPSKSPPPSKGLAPTPPSPPPPTSPPPPIPLRNGNSSSPNPHKQSPPPPPPPLPPPLPPPSPPPPPPPNSQAPPPPEKSSPSPTPSPPSRPPSNDSTPSGSGTSDNSPTKSPHSPVPPTSFGSVSNHPQPQQSPAMHGGSHAKSRGSSNNSSPGGGDNSGKYVGYTLAGVFIVALVAVAVVFTVRRKKTRGDSYDAPHMPPPNDFHIKAGADGYYYVQHPGVANGPHSGNNYGNGSHGGSMHRLGTPQDSAQPMSAQIVFSYDNIMEITNAFSTQNIIGEGGFGSVYKGWLPDGKAVAVKQLKAGSGQGDREFRAEVEIISRVHHRHLVSLVGYCISEQQRVLIYEYVPNGNLHHHLHGSGMPVLDWAKRLKIAIGAAKGLAYLHEDCSQKIIHRDIKSANILLDDAYEAQVADFGLARLTDNANTHVSTRVMGTFGYMAPEYATSGKLTDRSDVFSFGVVLLELVTGRKPVDQTQPLGDESLVEWARPLLLRAIETGDFGELIDPRLERHFVESEMFRMIEAAAACVRHSAPRRPRMVQVVRALDSGDELSDLSNGVKYGQSTVYDSGQYNKDIMIFRRMGNGSFVDSEFDMYSRDYSSSREMSGSQHAWMPSSSSGESESRAFNRYRSSTG